MDANTMTIGLILAVQAEIEGMKAENAQREVLGESMAYVYEDFSEKADEILNILNRPEV